jgi:sarcosine oxidase subunit gamma
MRRYDAQVAPVELDVVAVEASARALARVAARLGIDLPPGAASVVTDMGLLHRTGPESGLVLAPCGSAAVVVARLDATVGEGSAIVADLSEGHAWLSVTGPDALAVLVQGIAIDLREGAFPVGQATRTLCFGVEAILVRDGRDALRVGCRASYGEFLVARLRLACDPVREAS